MKKNITVLILSLIALSLSGQTTSVSKTTSSKTSVSVDKSNEKFLYTSYFDSVKTDVAKSIIVKDLGTPKESSRRMAMWKEKGVLVSIMDGKAQIEMDYNKADKAMISKVEKMADEISKSIK